ncbi:SDR family NAD(P)-dependent oxidoreductase [Pseudomonas laurylsulfatiphila]|uniref:SDR family NAD(P)-dependent oxidoreductase n=1 Tax=Pseudomonas laurylsulfatiphila TaxID=2011015 RepID=UPI00215FC914|nr:SDR family NAD(P)-dependent oxidoreductase [Pseudomonas laurylsulfatiphila]UVM02762.1 SDR family NAD(P)-dependent oxidoreductase [Pseudomonas laurylsulfatiphila]
MQDRATQRPRKFSFVFGARRGIGEATAKLLAQQGAHVIVSSRKLEAAVVMRCCQG